MVDAGYGLGRSLGDCRPAMPKGQKYQMVKTQTVPHSEATFRLISTKLVILTQKLGFIHLFKTCSGKSGFLADAKIEDFNFRNKKSHVDKIFSFNFL